MSKELHLPFEYHQHEVVPAQTLRFIGSSRLKLFGLIWLAVVIYLLLPIVAPGVFAPRAGADWATILTVTLTFLAGTLVTAFAMPRIDFKFNPLWKQKFVLHASKDKLRLNMEGHEKGLDIDWADVRRVQETGPTYILTFQTDRDFMLVPKAAFTEPGQESAFRALLRQHGSLDEASKNLLGEE